MTSSQRWMSSVTEMEKSMSGRRLPGHSRFYELKLQVTVDLFTYLFIEGRVLFYNPGWSGI